MTRDAIEFTRRFLLHVLPRGFVKIRYYGFLANRHRSAELARCRALLQISATAADAATVLTGGQRQAVERRCPLCGQGFLRIVEWLSVFELHTSRHKLTLPDPIYSSGNPTAPAPKRGRFQRPSCAAQPCCFWTILLGCCIRKRRSIALRRSPTIASIPTTATPATPL